AHGRDNRQLTAGRLALSALECQATLDIPLPLGRVAAAWHSRHESAKWPLINRRLHRMKLKPLGDRVIVQALEEEETTASGIVLPDTAKEKPQKGKVLAVGDGKWDEDGEKRIPLDVSEGDEVLY